MNKLEQLITLLSGHEAINNLFYEQWITRKLSIEKIAIFIRNYREFTYYFPESLALLIANTENVFARMEYTKTLYSEMGYGEPQRIHLVLFEDFAKNLLKHLDAPDTLIQKSLQGESLLLPETQNFVRGQRELYSGVYSVAVGAQLALEWQAYTMIRKLYEGVRNYMDAWRNPDEFYEACEFFYVHIGSAEKEHKKESIAAANELVNSGGSIEQIESGFKQHLHLIATFWNAIAIKMDKTDK